MLTLTQMIEFKWDSDYTAVNEWCEFLSENEEQLLDLTNITITNQQLLMVFDMYNYYITTRKFFDKKYGFTLFDVLNVMHLQSITRYAEAIVLGINNPIDEYIITYLDEINKVVDAKIAILDKCDYKPFFEYKKPKRKFEIKEEEERSIKKQVLSKCKIEI
jgi:hypothetical protein